MSLSKEDLADIRKLVVEGTMEAINAVVIPRLDEHDRRFDALEADMAEVKQDVRVLKDDVRVLKEDVRILKQDMREVKDSLSHLEGRVEALEADIKELYAMVEAQKPTYADKKFAKLPIEQKVLKMYEDFKLLAHEVGVTLPS